MPLRAFLAWLNIDRHFVPPDALPHLLPRDHRESLFKKINLLPTVYEVVSGKGGKNGGGGKSKKVSLYLSLLCSPNMFVYLQNLTPKPRVLSPCLPS